jgi:magnesium transporter
MLKRIKSNPGAARGIEHDEIILLPGETGRVTLTCIDYCPAEIAIQNIDNLEDFLDRHRPDWSVVRWIDVTGLSDMRVIHALATKYNLHPLAVEDVLHLSQRPKVEAYGDEDSEIQARLFIVVHTLQMKGESLHSEQVSVFLGHKTVLTFQEAPSEVWDPIHQRINVRGPHLLENDLATASIHSLLVHKYNIPLVKTVHVIEARSLPQTEAQALQVGAGTAAFFIDRLTYTSRLGRIFPAVWYQAYYRGDEYQSRAEFDPSP